MGAHSFNQVIGYRNLEEMKCKIAHYSYRTTKEEALDLPPKIYTTRQVDLTIEQERHYQSIKKLQWRCLKLERWLLLQRS